MTPFTANVDGNGIVLDASNGRNQRVLLLELPLDWRAGPAWTLRSLRLRCGDASASLSAEPFGSGRVHQGEEAAARVSLEDGKDFNCNSQLRE